MSNKGNKQKQSKRLLGTFTLPSGQIAVGELRINGASTLLMLHSDSALDRVEHEGCVTGVAYTGDHLTLIDCRSPGSSRTWFKDGPTKYHADVFPHYVTVGRHHLKPAESCVTGIHFTTNDLTSIFYDFDAFSHVINAEPIIDAVLRERREMHAVEAGPYPQVFYFTGKDCITEVQTSIGKVSVHHRPQSNMGGPEGVFIKNKIMISIQPEMPITFSMAIDKMYEISSFLSVVAGRAQGIKEINITTTDIIEGVPQTLAVHPSYRWKVGSKNEHYKPHPADVPLDPIRRRDEFDAVMTNWIGRHCAWRVARGQYLGCLRKANKYGSERLVAAANMFDLLPADAVPLVSPLTDEVATAREECVKIFREFKPGPDRNSVLSALGRLGQPSLPKKVIHRAAIVESQLGSRFQDLQFVASIAVKVRNFFVHGNSGDIEYEQVEQFLPFLTDSLEFIFAASDLIEAGWDASRWSSAPKGWGHSFTRFCIDYDSALAELRPALAK